MHLVYHPDPEGWATVGDLAPHDKYINPVFNTFAEG